MSNNTLTMGHDISVDFFDGSTGKMVSFPAVTGFSRKQMTKNGESEPLNGPPLFYSNPKGWSGTLTFDRTDASIDLYFAARDAAYYQGQNLLNLSIIETTKEANGTISQYRYTNVAFEYTNAGDGKASDKQTLSLNFQASERKQVL